MRGLIAVTGIWDQLLEVNPDTHQRDLGTVIFEGFQVAACDRLSYDARYLEYAEGERVRLTFPTAKLLIFTQMLMPTTGFELRLTIEEVNTRRPSSASFNVEWIRNPHEEKLPWIQNYLDLRVCVHEIDSPIGTFVMPLDVEDLFEMNTMYLQEIYDIRTQDRVFPVDYVKMHILPIEEDEEN